MTAIHWAEYAAKHNATSQGPGLRTVSRNRGNHSDQQRDSNDRQRKHAGRDGDRDHLLVDTTRFRDRRSWYRGCIYLRFRSNDTFNLWRCERQWNQNEYLNRRVRELRI